MSAIPIEPSPEGIRPAVWVAMADDVVAGYAVTWCLGEDGMLLENLAVAPEQQGRGWIPSCAHEEVILTRL